MITLLFRVFGTGNHRRHVAALLATAVIIVLAGAGLFAATQNLPFTTGLYWAITTATTEGTYRLVVGMNPAVPAILDELAAVGIPVVLAADVDPATVRDGVHVVRGDPTEQATIKAAHPEGAEQALITGGSDGDVLVSAVILRRGRQGAQRCPRRAIGAGNGARPRRPLHPGRRRRSGRRDGRPAAGRRAGAQPLRRWAPERWARAWPMLTAGLPGGVGPPATG